MDSLAPPVVRRLAPARSGFRLLLAVCPAAFVGMVSATALSPFLPRIADDLAATVPLVGQVTSTTMTLATVLGLLVGPLADHFGHRRALLVGTLAVVGSGLVIALSPTVTVLFLAAITGAISRSIIVPVALAVVGANLDEEASRRAISRVVVATAVGLLVGPPILTTIGEYLGWRAAFAALALLGLLAALLVRRLLPSDAARSGERLDLRGLLRAYQTVAHHGRVLALYGASLLRNTIAWVIGIYYGVFLIERHGFSLPEVGLAFSAFGLGLLGGSYAFGGRIGRLPLRPLIGSVYVVHGLLFAAFLLLPTDPWLAVSCMILAAFANGGTDVLEPTLLTRESPGGRATTMALYGAGMSLGSALGGAIGGLLLVFGGFTALGLGLPVLSLIAVLLLWASRSGASTVVAAR